MKNKILGSAVVAALATIGTTANADFTTMGAASLTITEGVPTCLIGGSYPNCDYGAFSVAAGGSYFKMKGNPAAVLSMAGGVNSASINGDAGVGIRVNDGIQIDNGDNPPVAYNGSGNNAVDAWNFFGNVGTNFTDVAVEGASATTLDMSGWRVRWGDVLNINMGGDGQAITQDASGNYITFGTGIADVACTDGANNATTCNIGDNYALTYAAVVPAGDPSGFGGVLYELFLNGTIAPAISSVPVPAAVWLFGSGLLGLVGVARRKKSA